MTISASEMGRRSAASRVAGKTPEQIKEYYRWVASHKKTHKGRYSYKKKVKTA